MHVIRLRGPWELVVAADAESPRPPDSQRVTVPCDPAEILGADFAGQTRLIRPFNTPTNLDPHERVYLVLEGLPATAGVRLNGAPLPSPGGPDSASTNSASSDSASTESASPGPSRIDITPQLALHNRLEVTLDLPGGSLGEVRLEIG